MVAGGQGGKGCGDLVQLAVQAVYGAELSHHPIRSQ